jgi:hypothetical protein
LESFTQRRTKARTSSSTVDSNVALVTPLTTYACGMGTHCPSALRIAICVGAMRTGHSQGRYAAMPHLPPSVYEGL